MHAQNNILFLQQSLYLNAIVLLGHRVLSEAFKGQILLYYTVYLVSPEMKCSVPKDSSLQSGHLSSNQKHGTPMTATAFANCALQLTKLSFSEPQNSKVGGRACGPALFFS